MNEGHFYLSINDYLTLIEIEYFAIFTLNISQYEWQRY